MKKTLLIVLMVLPLLGAAQTKIKETAVPRSVILALERTFSIFWSFRESYLMVVGRSVFHQIYVVPIKFRFTLL